MREMTGADDALDRLCEHAGIASGYRDTWGRDHATSNETRVALLQAMGVVIGEPADAAAALREREERDWQPGLPPICVRRRDERPYQWEFCCDGRDAERTMNWTLALETGEMLSGDMRPAELRSSGHREFGAARRIKALFQWPRPLPLGYHRFQIDSPAAGEAYRMALIIAPASCYIPPELARGARAWGPALQLYALRSKRNWGVGDFTDLRDAIEFFARSGSEVIGLNPLHALFPHDPGHSSPYSPSSRGHLNPLYIDVEAIPEFGDCRAARDQVADRDFQSRLRTLRGAELVDYPAVTRDKLGVLRVVYQAFRERDMPARSARAAGFSRFVADGGEPLLQFALYHALQEDFHSRDSNVRGWPAWPEPYRNPGSPAVRAYLDAHRERVEFHAWLQWVADDQLSACAQRSRELGLTVGLYRDLAVSIDRAGAESWAWRDLHATSASVGSPPDEFNLYGQNWDLPPLIPERLAGSAYAPYIATLRANMKHAGALRVDHVMALKRLFWLPPGATPEQGAYVRYPFHDLLGILALESQRNRCMVIGEDLGTLPEGFFGELQAAGVHSYRLLMFEKEADGGFARPAAYPEQAVAATGTHDLPTLTGFWLGHDLDVRARLHLYPSDGQRARQVVDRARERTGLLVALEREGLLPPGMSTRTVAEPRMTADLVLAVHAYLARSRARLMMVQMEDVFGQLEQVNLPASGGQYANWQRRLSLNLEAWADDDRIQALVKLLCGMRCASAQTREKLLPGARSGRLRAPKGSGKGNFSG